MRKVDPARRQARKSRRVAAGAEAKIEDDRSVAIALLIPRAGTPCYLLDKAHSGQGALMAAPVNRPRRVSTAPAKR